jgi:hypothetical protein
MYQVGSVSPHPKKLNKKLWITLHGEGLNNMYQESLKIKKPGAKVRLARRADNLAAIY